jgi:hypothetical protein
MEESFAYKKFRDQHSLATGLKKQWREICQDGIMVREDVKEKGHDPRGEHF